MKQSDGRLLGSPNIDDAQQSLRCSSAMSDEESAMLQSQLEAIPSGRS